MVQTAGARWARPVHVSWFMQEPGMLIRVFIGLLLGAAAVVWSDPRPRATQGPPSSPVRLPEISHIGFVVRDVDRAARTFGAVVGVLPIPSQPEPGGMAHTKGVQLRLTNITIDLMEPTAARGRASGDRLSRADAFLEVHGPGIHHIGFASGNARLEEQRRRLLRDLKLDGLFVESRGEAGFIDVRSTLGLMLELSSPATRERRYGAGLVRPFSRNAPLARLPCVTHIGVVVRDIERSRRAYASGLQVEPSPVREFTSPATGTAKVSFINLRNVNIELLQQAGDGRGPYADALAHDESRPHHLGFHLRGAAGPLETREQIAWFERHGGTLAEDGGAFAYLDYRSEFGVFFEALDEASNNRVYPHPHPGETP